jgi:hypothetical protein
VASAESAWDMEMIARRRLAIGANRVRVIHGFVLLNVHGFHDPNPRIVRVLRDSTGAEAERAEADNAIRRGSSPLMP